MSTNYFRNSPIALFLLPLLRWNVCCTSSKYVPVSEYIWWVTEIQSLILIQKKVNIAPNAEHYILLLFKFSGMQYTQRYICKNMYNYFTQNQQTSALSIWLSRWKEEYSQKTRNYYWVVKLNAVLLSCRFYHLLTIFILVIQTLERSGKEVVFLKYIDLYSILLGVILVLLPQWDALSVRDRWRVNGIEEI